MVRGFGVTRLVGREGGRRGVTTVAVAARGMVLVERGRTRVAGRGRGARQHPDVGRAFVTGRAAADRRRDGGVSGDREGRSGDARGTELEATGIHIRRAVAARAVAIETADREVIAGRADQGDVEERPDRRTVTGEAAGDALVRAGDGGQRIAAGGGVAPRAP